MLSRSHSPMNALLLFKEGRCPKGSEGSTDSSPLLPEVVLLVFDALSMIVKPLKG